MRISFLIGFLVLSSCAGSRLFKNDDPPEIDPYIDLYTKPVTWKHWIWCRNLCGRTAIDVDSVGQILESDFIICNCRNGLKFQVSRLK